MSMKAVVTCAALLLAASPLLAAAWGADGHAIVAHVAEGLLAAKVDAVLRADLGNISLSDASNWCDEFDHTRAGAWSSSLHYINYPGWSCDFLWDRDCTSDWCAAGALTNFTRQVFDTTLPASSRKMALQFVIHLMGDIHQPLHVARAEDEGGNLIKVQGFHFSPRPQFWHNGSATLHSIWDTAIVDQGIYDLQFNTSVAGGLQEPEGKYKDWWLFSRDLLERLGTSWAPSAAAWGGAVAGGGRSEARLRAGLAAVAGETAALGCGFAYHAANGQEVAANMVLDRDYYLRAKPVVEEQLAKAGVRLAQLLAEALEGAPLPPTPPPPPAAAAEETLIV